MLAPLSLLILLAIGLPISAFAQRPGLEVQAGLGYARVFSGGGPSFTAAVQQQLNPAPSQIQQRVGGSLWFANPKIASFPEDGREIVGIGVRYTRPA